MLLYNFSEMDLEKETIHEHKKLPNMIEALQLWHE